MCESLSGIARVIALAGLLSGALCAQFRGTVSGLVQDPQGAIIAGARVVATQLETGAKSNTVTRQTGQFNLPFLAPGTYTVFIEAAGFKRYVRDGLVVSANEPIALDVSLEVGQTSDSVTVSAEAALLQTETASTGQVINSKQVEDMPLNGRTPLVLAQLAFGVIPSNDPRFFRPFDDSGPSGFAMGGGAAKQNELLLDGTPDASVGNGLGYSPPVDAVTEVKVESFQADASFGHTGGGTVNVVTKSGTNTLHGTAYDFFQNSALGANPFFTNLAGQKKPSTNYNQWGATGGGPVFIPKVFNGRNKVFFFLAYEGINLKIPQATFTTVPTPAERNGDFSALLRLGASYQIYDPASGVRQGSRVARQPQAEAPDVPNRPGALASTFAAVDVGAVLDHGEIALSRQRQQTVHIREEYGQMHGQQGARSGSERVARRFDAEAIGIGIDVGRRSEPLWRRGQRQPFRPTCRPAG